MPSEPEDPDADAKAWQELLESLEIDAVLARISICMGRALRSHFSPEDVLQDSLLHAWRDRHEFLGRDALQFRRWLLRIAANRLRDLSDYLNAECRRPELKPACIHDHDAFATTTTPSRIACARERARLIEEAMGSLPEDLAKVVNDYLLGCDTMAEIAARHGLPLATAWSRFRRGRELYAKELEKLLDESTTVHEHGPVPSAP